MYTVPEQFSSATKANLEAQMALLTSFTGKAFESFEKFIDLNMNAAKSSLDESSATAKQLLGAKDAQEFFKLSAEKAQPAAEKFVAYSKHLANIASSAQAELSKSAESQLTETNRKVLGLFEEISKNAPPSAQNFVEMFKTAVNTANASYDQLSKTTKQAIEAMESNFTSAVNQVTQATGKTGAKTTTKK